MGQGIFSRYHASPHLAQSATLGVPQVTSWKERDKQAAAMSLNLAKSPGK